MQPLLHLVEVLGDRGQDDRPRLGGRAISACARIESGERGSLSGQDQVVQRGHQAQLRHRPRWRGDALEQPRHLTAVFDVLGGRAHQRDVERRAPGPHEHVGVPAEARGQRCLARLGVAAATIGKVSGIAHHG
jgi:hypothetical protein